jgi:hypothetical protein
LIVQILADAILLGVTQIVESAISNFVQLTTHAFSGQKSVTSDSKSSSLYSHYGLLENISTMKNKQMN